MLNRFFIFLFSFYSISIFANDTLSRPNGFLENKGQIKDFNNKNVSDVLFAFEGPGLNIFITTWGITYVFHQDSFSIKKTTSIYDSNPNSDSIITNWSRVDMILEAANISADKCKMEDTLSGIYNYYLSSPVLIQTRKFSKLTFSNVYPGIDWVLYIDNKQGVKYDFIVHPSANVSKIQLHYKWCQSVDIEKDGSLLISSLRGNIRENKPIALTQFNEKKPSVSFKKINENSIGFDIRGYNSSEVLVIDPQLTWSTYFSGSDDDGFAEINVDSLGNLIATGYSKTSNFPTLNPGGGAYFQGSSAGNYDAVIAKFSSTGVLLWSTYLGGSSSDQSYQILSDASNNYFITGYTLSSNFPVVNPGSGAYYQSTNAGGRDAFISKFSSNGALVWSSYFGGSQEDWGLDLAIENGGNIYATGYTASQDFPKQNPGGAAYFQNTFGGGGHDAYVLKLNSSNLSLLWSSYLGGSGDDIGRGIAVDNSGNIFVTGPCNTNFPIINPGSSAFVQNNYAGGSSDIFLTRFSPSLAITWSTYIGTVGGDVSNDVITDNNGNIYLGGEVTGTGFPLFNPGGGAFYQGIFGGLGDGFLMEFSPNATLVWSTYLGGNGIEDVYSISINNESHEVWLDGESDNSNLHFNNSGGCNDSASNAGGQDAFVARFTNRTLDWGTFFGGNTTDFCRGSCISASNCFYAVGLTFSNNIPIVIDGNSYNQSSASGSIDGYIMKFCPCGAVSINVNSTSAACNGICNGTANIYVSNAVSPVSYLWSTNQTTPSVGGLCAGTYSVVVTDNSGETDTSYITITTSNGPTASFNSNAVDGYLILNTDNQLCFEDNSQNAIAWQWNFNAQSSSNQQNPCLAVTQIDTGNYCVNLIVTDNSGCLDTTSACYIIENASYSVPNVFTPNGDGINDVFAISSQGIKTMKCEIYDRWGKQVYCWSALNGFWNGQTIDNKSASNGTYYYTVELTDDANHIYNTSGFIMLIR